MATCEFEFTVDALEQNAISVTEFAGKEEISRPFRFELDLLSTDKDLAFEDIVNRPAKLRIRRNNDDEESTICGQVIDFEQSSESRSAARYHAILVPRVWILSYTFQSCVFQNKTVKTIITDVLGEHGLMQEDVRFELTNSYSERDFCVQYRESDLDFICRLMEFEGMYFYFDHSGDQEVMVISDDRSNESFIDSTQGADVSYHQHEGNLAPDDIQTVNEFIYNEKVVTGKVVLKDYNYRESEMELQGEAQVNPEMPGMFYSYGSHFKDNTEGNRLAIIRNQEFECQRRTGRGKSDHVTFVAGYKFGMINHYREDINADYLLTSVHHSGHMIDGQGTYSNEFKCIPAEVQFRPERLTPEPRLPGILTARVEGSDDDSQYASIDEMGRYKVRMPFDQSDESLGSASKPIRLMQPSTGAGHGMHFPVHAGAEMLWACIDGNLDRPIGLGTEPNSTQISPVTAENNTQNLLQTSSGNRMAMDDTVENPSITLSSIASNASASSSGDGGDQGGMANIQEGTSISGNTISMDNDGVDIRSTVLDTHESKENSPDTGLIRLRRNDNQEIQMDQNGIRLASGHSNDKKTSSEERGIEICTQSAGMKTGTINIHSFDDREVLRFLSDAKDNKDSYDRTGIVMGTKEGGGLTLHGNGVFICSASPGPLYGNSHVDTVTAEYQTNWNKSSVWIPFAFATVRTLAALWSAHWTDPPRTIGGHLRKFASLDWATFAHGIASSTLDSEGSGSTIYGEGGVCLISPNDTGAFSAMGHGVNTTGGIDFAGCLGFSVTNLLGGIDLTTVQGGVGIQTTAPGDEISINAAAGGISMKASTAGIAGVAGGIEIATTATPVGPSLTGINRITLDTKGITLMTYNDVNMAIKATDLSVSETAAKVSSTENAVSSIENRVSKNEATISTNTQEVSSVKKIAIENANSIVAQQMSALESHV
ncbi:MAG: hypothetical protein CMP27_00140 [Roseibacillus sp.]|nr:hypothetical protein [Roseibacillus sp.]